MERPTFSPSYLTWIDDGPCAFRCHSFIRDGQIQFLSDCTHALAAQTVDIPDWDKPNYGGLKQPVESTL
jgi:hypothetical protein